jgi:hypothetical protein
MSWVLLWVPSILLCTTALWTAIRYHALGIWVCVCVCVCVSMSFCVPQHCGPQSGITHWVFECVCVCVCPWASVYQQCELLWYDHDLVLCCVDGVSAMRFHDLGPLSCLKQLCTAMRKYGLGTWVRPTHLCVSTMCCNLRYHAPATWVSLKYLHELSCTGWCLCVQHSQCPVYLSESKASVRQYLVLQSEGVEVYIGGLSHHWQANAFACQWCVSPPSTEGACTGYVSEYKVSAWGVMLWAMFVCATYPVSCQSGVRWR